MAHAADHHPSVPPPRPTLASNEALPPYFVQNAYSNPNHFSHHASVSALWQTKWRQPCSKGIYPFGDGKLEDFEPIFEDLIKMSGDDVKILYEPDEYAKPFFPVAEGLVVQGKQAEQAGDTIKAKHLFLRAACVYRIARFPINRSKLSQKAWEEGKAAYMLASKYLDPPNVEIQIPFTHAAANDHAKEIPVYLRVPKGGRPKNGWPVVIFICGLDAYRTDHTYVGSQQHIEAGQACLSVEIPGTGDCPAARDDPEGADRLWSSILDWIATTGKEQYGFDENCVLARGVSTGGGYAFRIAHTHADRLIGVVAQGGWCHHALNPDWVKAMNHMEYPFALGYAIAHKFGYSSIDDMCKAQPSARSKFGLVENGLLDEPSCRLLVVNGMLDSIFPIEDSILVTTRGKVKDVRLAEERYHMGDPGMTPVLLEWINDRVAEKQASYSR